MRKIVKILVIAIIGLYVPEVVTAQDSTETESDASSFSLKPTMALGIGVSYHYGGEFSVGAMLGDSIMSAMFCFTYPNTSIGLSLMAYPFKNAKWLGAGIDIRDDYKCNWKVYSEFYYGGLGQNTLGSPDTYWRITDFVLSPAIEFNVRLSDRCKLSSKTNLLFGFWSYSNSNWSRWKRYWNTDITLEISLGHSYSFVKITRVTNLSPFFYFKFEIK